MPKEILLYSGMYSWTVTEVIEALNANADDQVVLRINSPGGSVFDSWGLFAKMREHGNVLAKVDGIAASSAFNLLMYAKEVEALDVSTIMLHRADAYTETEEQKSMLARINKDLRNKMEARIDSEKFKTITGYTLDDVFNPETRINVWLTAKQAKDLGIVSKIVKLKPEEQKQMAQAMASWTLQIAAEHKPENLKSTDMTVEKLKAEFPAIYAAILSEGTKKEKDRVEAWMAYQEIDAEAVKKGIEGGEEVTTKVMAAMQVKGLSKLNLKDLKDGSEKEVETPEATAGKEKTEKEKQMASFEAEVDGLLGLKKA